MTFEARTLLFRAVMLDRLAVLIGDGVFPSQITCWERRFAEASSLLTTGRLTLRLVVSDLRTGLIAIRSLRMTVRCALIVAKFLLESGELLSADAGFAALCWADFTA